MAKKDSSKKEKEKPANQNGDIHVGGNVAGNNNVIGNNNVVNNYVTVVEKNTKQNDPDFWNLKHPYPMPPNFTGRLAERATLTQWLDGDSENRLFIFRALGGFGKSALAWQWLTHDVNPEKWKKVVFWSFYEGDASFENFTKETLEYLGIEAPQGGRPQVDELLKAMQRDNIFLLMDGFERVLRLYSSMNAAYQGDEEEKTEENQLDCKDINAEWFLKGICQNPKIQSKVLITTRLTPRAVKPRGEFMVGCRETELTAMQKSDAVEFFHKQGIKGNRAEIESACEPYGYHPLSLRLLAGYILKDFENPADIVVAQKIKIDGNIKQYKQHVLEVSYNNLPAHVQKLIGTIACFRSPVELKILKELVENKKTLVDDLRNLIDYGLLNFEIKNKRFDLHPIVRRYVYNVFSGKNLIHKKSARYFQKQLDKKIPENYRDLPKFLRRKVMSEIQKQIKTIEELAPAIELYYHTVQVGKFDDAAQIYHDFLMYPLYFRFSAYQTEISLIKMLLKNGLEKLNNINRAWALSELGSARAMSGQPHHAIPLFANAGSIYFEIPEHLHSFISITINLTTQYLITGSFKKAEYGINICIAICSEVENEHEKAIINHELARLLAYSGIWREAKNKLATSQNYLSSVNDSQSLCIGELYKSFCFLLMARSSKQDIKIIKLAIKSANQAIKLVENGDPNLNDAILPRDLIDANWLLGASYLATGDILSAETYIHKALNICRSINSVDTEANILLEYAKLLRLNGETSEAYKNAEEALLITERCGYVLQGADVNLFLAQYALEQEKDKAKAKVYAEEAKKLATCDGPPYYYKVAYEEAERFLENL